MFDFLKTLKRPIRVKRQSSVRFSIINRINSITSGGDSKNVGRPNRLSTDSTDSDLEEFRYRYRPSSIDELVKRTNFTKKELQLLYRGFKDNCPSAIITMNKFEDIFAQFFSYGDSQSYSRLVFNTFDEDGNGKISFDEFVDALSVLLRGSRQQKLQWIFDLYDSTNKRGYITEDDLFDVTKAIYDMMGHNVSRQILVSDIREHCQDMFQKLDLDGDGKISLEDFLESCQRDANILESLELFDTVWA